ncbi:MAG: Gfo/Idh/MocA family oxidoreductase [Opitutaceae bacterium]|nr:Gfo/Idh/MocA family oxidoreductase [Opitutaceae bacterium]
MFVPLVCLLPQTTMPAAGEIRIGIIGADTSHAPAFAKLINDPAAQGHVGGGRVTTVFKAFSPDMPLSAGRVDGFMRQLLAMPGVTAADSIEQLAQNVDAIMILSADGRAHPGLARRVIPFRKPIFIDKPLATTYRDAREIFRFAEQHGTPVFSTSSLRYALAQPALEKAAKTKMGALKGVFVWGPATVEPNHPDLFWYGIHSVESLYAVMGAGCVSVQRTHTPDADIITGIWPGERVGTIRAMRDTKSYYGLTLFGANAAHTEGSASGYAPLAKEIITFFQTGKSPVASAETLEIMAFMEAAELGKTRNGASVPLAEIIK